MVEGEVQETGRGMKGVERREGEEGVRRGGGGGRGGGGRERRLCGRIHTVSEHSCVERVSVRLQAV